MAIRHPEVSVMDKELYPIIEGVCMALFNGNGLVLLRGEEEHYTFDNIQDFHVGDPHYAKDYGGVTYCKYDDATMSISKQGDQWVAAVE